MTSLLLVDGSSYLYRAFHALPDLRNQAGEPTGAIYGIVAMLRRLRQDFPSQYSACVFDAKGKTFRDDWYPEYKGTRKAMPEDLVRQIEPIHAIVAALGWPILMVEGIEADDVIGTLAAQAHQVHLKTVVSTGDKDLAQLVNEDVTLVNTMSNEILDRAGVEAKFGVPPEGIVDYLTLVGDTVDNIPGVEKVGPKTALKWLGEYRTLENIVAHADQIGGVVGENLRRALDWLPMARKLVTVRTDCDLSPHLTSIEESLRFGDPDAMRLRELFERYGFKTWLKDLGGDPAPSSGSQVGRAALEPKPAAAHPTPPTATRYETILTEAQLDEWVERIEQASLTAFDTETTSLEPMQARLVGMSFCVEAGHAAYLPLAHRSLESQPAQLPLALVLSRLRGWLENPRYRKVGQNLKYDTHVLENHGVHLAGIVHDTLLESYVLESHRNHSLDDLVRRHLDKSPLTYEDVCGKGANQIGFDAVAIDRATQYAAEDADVTLQVHQVLYPHIAADAKLEMVYAEIEIPTSIVLQKMERKGVLIDAALLERQSSELGARMTELEGRAIELAGQPFNLNSPKQIGEIFFDKLKLPVVKKTSSGAPSTDEEVLQKLAEDFPLPRVLLDYRTLSKLKSTYTDKLPRMVSGGTGRVHTNYAQAVAVTGRLASNDPNLQNIPIRTAEGRRVREAFIASPGHLLVSADYSQIELRIMAHISGDANLCAAFARGEDVHRRTAAEIFGVAAAQVSSEQRRYAKVINFGLMYGMSAFGLASNLGIERDAAKLYIDRYFERYPQVARYMQETRLSAKQLGYVETVFGRRLWLPEINSPNGPRRQAAERAAINAPMQGTAADLIKLSMIAVQNWIEAESSQSAMVMQVHDELVLEVPEDEIELIKKRLPELMAGVAQLAVPLEAEVGVGANWDEAH
jgi:DNA polymerase-1